MKRIVAYILILSMLLAIMPLTVLATTGADGLVFELSEDGSYYIVSDYEGATDGVVIPSTYNDLPVKEIGRYAFFDSKVLNIKIPDSVTTISDYAFYNCGILSIEIPDSVTMIGDYAFYNCGILSIEIPDSVTMIGDSAFVDCESLTSAVIGNSVATIGNRAFYRCFNLKSINIPNSVTTIGYNAFYFCNILTSVIIPDSVTTIGNDAFSGCSALETITVNSGNTVYHSAGNCLIETETKTLIQGCKNSVIPSDGSVTTIDDYAFYNYTGITSIEIPNSVTTIGDYAFCGCSGLTSVNIPNSVTTIGNKAFSYCERLTSAVIGNSVATIGKSAFLHCDGLETIMVESANEIYHSAGNCLVETAAKTLIQGCKNSVIPSDGSVTTICDSAFGGCSRLTSIEIPDSVTTIGEGAFFGCDGLTSITIPNSVLTIGDNAFSGCANLTDIYCEAESKPLSWSLYWNNFCNATVHWRGVTEEPSEEPSEEASDYPSEEPSEEASECPHNSVYDYPNLYQRYACEYCSDCVTYFNIVPFEDFKGTLEDLLPSVPAGQSINLDEAFKRQLDYSENFDYSVDYQIHIIFGEFPELVNIPGQLLESLAEMYFEIDVEVLRNCRDSSYYDKNIHYDPQTQTYAYWRPPQSFDDLWPDGEYAGFIKNGDRYEVYYRHLDREVLPDEITDEYYQKWLEGTSPWMDEIEYNGKIYVYEQGWYFYSVPCDYGHKYTVEFKDGITRIISVEDYVGVPEKFDHIKITDGIETVLPIGDVNADGEIDTNDYVLLRRAVMETYTVSDVNNPLADVNGDGVFKMNDYIMLRRHVMGTYVIGG